MSFTFKFKEINEERQIVGEGYTIENLLDELKLSSQTIVSKQNGELAVEDNIIKDGDEIQLIQIIYGG